MCCPGALRSGSRTCPRATAACGSKGGRRAPCVTVSRKLSLPERRVSDVTATALLTTNGSSQSSCPPARQVHSRCEPPPVLLVDMQLQSWLHTLQCSRPYACGAAVTLYACVRACEADTALLQRPHVAVMSMCAPYGPASISKGGLRGLQRPSRRPGHPVPPCTRQQLYSAAPWRLRLYPEHHPGGEHELRLLLAK